MDYFWSAVWSVTPTVLVSLVFGFIVWAIIRTDRHERQALAKVETEERARLRTRSPSA